MGGCGNIGYTKAQLSPPLRNKVLDMFQKMDIDGSKTIEKSETVKFWYKIK